MLALVIAAIPLGLWMATAFLFTLVADGAGTALDDLGRRLALALPGAIVVGVAVYLAAVRARRNDEVASSFVLLLMALGFFLVMVADLFHIVDAFSGPWRRMNTVFKVYYQAWLLLGITGTFAIYTLWSGRASMAASRSWISVAGLAGKWGGAAVLALLLVGSLYYTLGATLERGGAHGAPQGAAPLTAWLTWQSRTPQSTPPSPGSATRRLPDGSLRP